MDVERVSAHKKELEQQLTARILDFQKRTGCAVTDMCMQRVEVMGDECPHFIGLQVTVEVP